MATVELPTAKEAELAIAQAAFDEACRSTVAFVELYSPKVPVPGIGLVEYVPYPKQVALLNDLDAGRSALAFKSRQTGISTTVMIQRLRACLEPNRTHLVVSAKRELAAELISIARTAALNCTPPFPLKITTDNANELGFENESRIVGEASTKETGRTYAVDSALLDEVRSLLYPDDMWQSLAPTTTHGGSICMVSTPDIEGSFYHSHWYDVSNGLSEWGYHKIHWRDWPDRTEDWANETRKRLKFTAQQWDQEYELEWGSVGDAVFSKESVDLAVRLGQESYEPPATWGKGHAAIGGDLSGGGRAETVVLVLDKRKRPCRVIDVRHDDKWAGVVSSLDIPKFGVFFTGGEKVNTTNKREPNIPRDKLYGHLAYDVEQGMVAVPEKFQPLILAMRSLTWAKTGQYLDHVDALALAYWGATGGPRKKSRSGVYRPRRRQQESTDAGTPAGPLGITD
jgi:hypothetical protein